MLKYKSILQIRDRQDKLDANESQFWSTCLHQSETEIIKMAQQRKFSA